MSPRYHLVVRVPVKGYYELQLTYRGSIPRGTELAARKAAAERAVWLMANKKREAVTLYDPEVDCRRRASVRQMWKHYKGCC